MQDDANERKSDLVSAPPAPSSERIHVVTEAVARPEIREIPLSPRADEPTPILKLESADANEDIQEADLGDLVTGAADQVRRAGRSVNRGFQNVADQLEELADRLESVAGLGEARGASQLAAVARKSSTLLGDSALYFRTADVKDMRGDLEGQVRTQPLKTLLVAAAAGSLVGKIVR